MLRIVKPKTKRAKRMLEKRAPKVDENVKRLMLLQGTKSSSLIKNVISDLYHLKKAGGAAVKFSRKNDNVRPFEGGGETSLEFLSAKTDCSLFAFGTHSKKRPNNLVIGRMYDHHVLDMIELGVDKYQSIAQLGGGRKAAPQEGSKPCFAFLGDAFESKPELAHLKEMLLDFFRGEEVETINVGGLDRVFVCAAAGDKVYLRHCGIELKKSDESKFPRVELVEVGPCFDISIRRSRKPSEDLRREAMKMPLKTAKKKVKNVKGDSLQGKIGKIYMPKQEVEGMALAKMKGLKRERRQAAAAKAAAAADTPAKEGDGSVVAEETPTQKKARL
ncbi:ribosome production factor 2 [Marchantia polymorpha subsp. ruderalis]|nr:hypothetical protein MARPO_0098s0050 [Marchantia polymorpha]BBN07155.1 hypothetical protein Mp_4g01500 [Marchantia polymorpha subsp. ruderalis]|eukprot:PTQ32504.1 hypothetical protein MARPO_0098s0050 [Marchantia polymorpha]